MYRAGAPLVASCRRVGETKRNEDGGARHERSS
uniref:Uncharacterized protein n=1 Tax=Arundo donax TaxID=35708 RepID=A0A0A8ZKA2_ARUDO